MINTNKCAWDKVYTTANVEDCRISIGDVNIILHNIIKEEKDHYEIKMEVHGIENIQISYEKLTGLIVKGSKETLNGRRNVRNTFKINDDIYDLKQLSASIHKGILTICIGKKQEYKEKVLCTLKNEESLVLSNKVKSKITHYHEFY